MRQGQRNCCGGLELFLLSLLFFPLALIFAYMARDRRVLAVT